MFMFDVKKIKSLMLILNIALMVAVAPGCGSNNNDDESIGGGSSLNSSGSLTGSTQDPNVPNPGQGQLPSGNSPTGGSRALYTYSVQGWGPANTSSTYLTTNVGYANNVGLDNNLRVRVKFGAAIQNKNTSTGQLVGTINPYTKLGVTISVLVDGVVRGTQTVMVAEGQPQIVDFSGAVRNYATGSGNPYISFRYQDMMSNYKTTGVICTDDYAKCCASTASNCSDYYYYGTYAPDYSMCNQRYMACTTPTSPVNTVLASSGWAFSIDMETDVTNRL